MCSFAAKCRRRDVPDQEQRAQRLALETDLHHALQGDELYLVYQPIFDISRQRLESVETLIRWRRADGTQVPPDMFIPIAEQSHLIVQIGKWVVWQACHDLATLRAANFKDLKLHVSMAATEFTNKSFPDELLALVAALNLEPACLSLELTEGMLMKRPDQVIPVMRSLRQLALLKNLPISSLKIDRSFVRDLPQQRNDRAIVKTIVDLGCHMDLKVIAEGVETTQQLEILRQAGCNLIQGYLRARPMTLAELMSKYPAWCAIE